MSKYTRLFIDETRSYLDTISHSLSSKEEGGKEDFSESQRLAHSIKGMALFEEQSAIAGLAYALEQGFEEMDEAGARGPLKANLTRGVEFLRQMIGDVEEQGLPKGDPTGLVELIVKELR